MKGESKMEKKVLILSTSPRQGGNSDLLADAFLQGALEAGHSAEKISLAGKNVQFCEGCLACQQTRRCVQHDDMEEITEKMRTAQVLVFATPVYYYGMCGQMKTMLDRANPLFGADYAFRDVYLLATAAEEEESAVDGTVAGVQCWLACFEQARLRGVLRGCGVTRRGEIRQRPELLRKAQEMGRSV